MQWRDKLAGDPSWGFDGSSEPPAIARWGGSKTRDQPKGDVYVSCFLSLKRGALFTPWVRLQDDVRYKVGTVFRKKT